MFTEKKSTKRFLFGSTYQNHVNDRQAIHALRQLNLHEVVNHQCQVKNQIPCFHYGDIDLRAVDYVHSCLLIKRN